MRHFVIGLSALFSAALMSAGSIAGERNSDDVKDTPAEAVAIFAGGCFWCMEPPFDKVEGVLETTSGFTGGHTEYPSYEEVSRGGTGHMEAVLVRYDPARVSYLSLLKVFWTNIDPVDDGGQFCDRGSSYRPAIFYSGDQQQLQANRTLTKLNNSGIFDAAIATRILPAGRFYPAEDYHQNYYRKNPIRYKFYRYSCGRDSRLDELWGGVALPF